MTRSVIRFAAIALPFGGIAPTIASVLAAWSINYGSLISLVVDRTKIGLNLVGGIFPLIAGTLCLISALRFLWFGSKQLAVLTLSDAAVVLFFASMQQIGRGTVGRVWWVQVVGSLILVAAVVVSSPPKHENLGSVIAESLLVYGMAAFAFLLGDAASLPAVIRLGATNAYVGGLGSADANFAYPLGSLVGYAFGAVFYESLWALDVKRRTTGRTVPEARGSWCRGRDSSPRLSGIFGPLRISHPSLGL